MQKSLDAVCESSCSTQGVVLARERFLCYGLPSQMEEIGRGQFGVTMKAIDRLTGEQVAVKLIPRGDRVSNRALMWLALPDTSAVRIQPRVSRHVPAIVRC